jgi:hypothetical protein
MCQAKRVRFIKKKKNSEALFKKAQNCILEEA